MARRLLFVLLAATASVIAGQAAAQPRAVHSRAHLALTHRSPLTVRGTGFHTRERVWVVAHGGPRGTFSRRVTASASGAFSAVLVGRAHPCGHIRITATGSGGSRAALTGINLPDCIVY